LKTALLLLTDLSRSAVDARTRSTQPLTSSKPRALIRHRFVPGLSPQGTDSPFPKRHCSGAGWAHRL